MFGLIIKIATSLFIALASIFFITNASARQQEESPAQFVVPIPTSKNPFDYSTFKPSDYVLSATPTLSNIKIDGRLIEKDWIKSEVANNFFQLEPFEGSPASFPTEVRILYDEKNLYVGFICFDPDTRLLMAPDMKRDTRMSWSNDMVSLVIASLDQYREAYEFQTNPNGARYDAFVSREGSNTDRDWNGLWNAASQIHEYGWSAEFVIPYNTLRFPDRQDQVWGINFGRRIQRVREESYWVPLNRKDGEEALYRFGKGGRLKGLTGIKPGGRVQVAPFLVLGAQSARDTETPPTITDPIASTKLSNNMARQMGGNLKLSITSGITLNATVNPDFAQIEADDEVVNLSRFDFKFDEKRPFFLERSDIFRLNQVPQRRGPRGGGNNDRTPQLFFSRRIGKQLPNGKSVPIDLGIRLTGKVGRTTVGFLNVQTRQVDYEDDGEIKTEPLTNWQALRIVRDVGDRSSIGMMATFKEPNPRGNDIIGAPLPRYSSSEYNRVLGFDINLASRRTNHRGQFTFAKSFTDTLSTSKQNWTLRMMERWQNRWISYGGSFLDIGEDFDSHLGFLRETGLQRIGLGVQTNTFLRKYGIRQLRGGIRNYYITKKDTDFTKADSWGTSPNIFIEMERGIWLNLTYNKTFDTLNKTTRIGGVHFPAGSYTYDQGSLFMLTDSGRKFSLQTNLRWGTFYDANLFSLSGKFSIKPNPRLAIEPGITRSQVDRGNRTGLDEDQFEQNTQLIPNIRMSYSLTPNMSFSSYMQFNANRRRDSDDFHLNTVTMNLLVSYRSPFGHSFLLAYNQFRDDDIDTDDTFSPFARTPLRLRDQQIVAKVSYLFNL